MTMTTDDHLHVILTRDGRVRGAFLFDTVEKAIAFAAKEFVYDEQGRLSSQFQFEVFAAPKNVTNFVHSAKHVGYVDWDHDENEEICKIRVTVVSEFGSVVHEAEFVPDDYECAHESSDVIYGFSMSKPVHAFCRTCGRTTQDFEYVEDAEVENDGEGWYAVDTSFWKAVWH